MEEKKNTDENNYFEAIVKKTKTGITLPKELREILFESDSEIYFKLVVPKEKNQIILNIISKDIAEETLNKKTNNEPIKKVKKNKLKNLNVREPKWAEYFVYDFENRDKVQSILESAYYKFAKTPVNFDDAIGRIKYTLISFLSPTKTENAKLYYSVIRFLIDVIQNFKQYNLIEWIYEKVIPNIDSKFLYELALLDLIEVSYKIKNVEKVEILIKEVLESIDKYNKSEWYNIMSSLNQLVKKIKNYETPINILNLIKNKLIKYENEADVDDYKIQIIELLEILKFIEDAYRLADNLLKSLPPESIKLAEIRKIRNRLKEKPL